MGEAVDKLRPRAACQQGRTNRALKINCHFILRGAQVAERRADLFPSLEMKQAGAPLLCVYDVNLVNERTLWRTRHRARGGKSAEQLRPAFFDNPAMIRLGISDSQHTCCGKIWNSVD